MSRRFKAKRTPLLISLIILAAIGGILFLTLHKNNSKSTSDVRRYVSFQGNYSFTIPTKYTANGTALAGATLVYPEGSPPQNGQNLSELYANGTVALQPLEGLKDRSVKAFAAYVKDVLAVDLRKNLSAPSDIRQSKQKGDESAEIYALGDGGKNLRTLYAIDFTQPVLVTAKDRSEAFKTVAFSMEDLKKSDFKSDTDQAGQAAKEIALALKDKKVKELRDNATNQFKKQKSEAQLSADLGDANSYLQRPINIVGGLYDGKYFIAQLIFEARTQDEQPAVGVLSLHKIGRTWKLDGLQLPGQGANN